MSSNINLLVKKDKKLLKEQGKLKAFRLIAIGSLVILLIISALTVFLNQQLSNNSIEKDREAILSEMSPFSEKEAKLNVVSNRIGNISKVQSKRIDIYRIVDTILGKVPEGMLVDSLEFNEKKITMKVSSASLVPVDLFINNLVNMAKKREIIKALSLESLEVFELVGSYKVSVNINI